MKNKILTSIDIFVMLLMIILYGCNFNRTFINREEDKVEAEKVCNKFFEEVRNNEFQNALPLFSQQFWETTDTSSFRQSLLNVQEKLGNLKETKLSDWKVKLVEGTNPSSDYEFLYENKYDKSNSKEYFHLVKEKDSIKIVKYTISESLIK